MSKKKYDAIIIGSGFGGSFAAYSLAKAGLSTLVLERGDYAKRDSDDWNPKKIFLPGGKHGYS